MQFVAAIAIGAAFFIGRSIASLEAGPLGSFGEAREVTWEPGLEVTSAISPDRKLVARRLAVGLGLNRFRLSFGSRSQPLGLFIATRKSGGGWSVRKRAPAGHWADFSPDGRYLSFVTALSGSALNVIPVDSGPSGPLFDRQANVWMIELRK